MRNPAGALFAANLILNEADRGLAVQQAVLGAVYSQTAAQALLLLDRANVSDEIKTTIREQLIPKNN